LHNGDASTPDPWSRDLLEKLTGSQPVKKKIHKLYAAKDRLNNEIYCIWHKSLFRAAYRSKMCYSTMNALDGVSGVRTTAMLVVP
jgi:hypothetical protein